MHATLENKPWFLRFRLILQIHFSEEEKAIITTRTLGKYGFDISPGAIAIRSPEMLQFLRSLAFLLFFGSIFFSFIAYGFYKELGTYRHLIDNIIGLCFIAGPVLYVYTITAQISQRNITPDYLTIGYMLKHPHLIITTPDPSQIPDAERNILKGLSDLKAFLAQTHELVKPRKYEI